MRVKSEELIDVGLSASLRSFLFVSQSVSLSLSVMCSSHPCPPFVFLLISPFVSNMDLGERWVWGLAGLLRVVGFVTCNGLSELCGRGGFEHVD